MPNNSYEVILADTEESKNIHYNLRYQIFCLEKRFEEASKCKDEMEKDTHDDNAIHFLVKSNNRWIGSFRLVIDQFGNLPFQKVSALDPLQFLQRNLEIAEFSRLGVLRPFQKLRNGQPPKESSESESEIMLKMIHAGVDYCRTNGLGHIIILCRRSISRVLNQFGLEARPIGPAVFHHGPRVPFVFNLANLHAFDAIVNSRLTARRAYSVYSEIYSNEVPLALAA
ncbi:PEP-CTERM/exosortase system-associated acyltransferase [Candidatus Nitrotoga sp. 1052]|uniref:PEP-CTERM/exosortase system-associated acyltransferase n=1 Tax=Candidatus Nitrotoga sp. 1052 TaxID=2886964 RepID=UPI001EF5C691|nr:PEP-CTERM/exosortase system-associated acyltransferase [Candidatus Nitrotoga sp. 1052]CAH1084771.1 N-acyl amino acid synthase of PEP-CTERM/exosortase system [Candidatus Nitrotoga sp. 1052]